MQCSMVPYGNKVSGNAQRRLLVLLDAMILLLSMLPQFFGGANTVLACLSVCLSVCVKYLLPVPVY